MGRKKKVQVLTVEEVSKKFMELCVEFYHNESAITKDLANMPVPNIPHYPSEEEIVDAAQKNVNKVKIYHESLLAYRTDIMSRSNVLKNQFEWLKMIVKTMKDESKNASVDDQMKVQAEKEVTDLGNLIKKRIGNGITE